MRIHALYIFSLISLCTNSYGAEYLSYVAKNIAGNNIAALFPCSAQELEHIVSQAQRQIQYELNKLYSIPKAHRSFTNTLVVLDKAVAHCSSVTAIITVLSMVSPDEQIRKAAQQALITLQKWALDKLVHNQKLYTIVRSYSIERAPQEKLTQSQKYFIEQLLRDYKHSGLHLSGVRQEQLKQVKQELAQLELAFETAIASDNKTICVAHDQLTGLSPEFISTLKKTPEGQCILGIDYPTYSYVLDNCTCGKTREKLWRAFNTCAYPENHTTLARIVLLREKLAKLLGYESYTCLDIDGQMAENKQIVTQFLNNLVRRAGQKVQQEVQLLKQHLPPDITLVNNKFKPWDYAFVSNYYKKRFLDLDETAISHYFRLEHTLEQLFKLYKNFFGVTFEKVALTHPLWHSDVQLLRVYKNKQFLGSILLDLFPRAHKYTHACQVCLVPSIGTKNSIAPALVLVIANFPKPTPQTPALLKRTDVITFFHECGHALHSLLGSTQLATQSGTQVKTDFVEMPSQMLEEFMWCPQVLKDISKHYKTGEHLPDAVSAKIEQLKNYNSGEFVQGQLYYSYFALTLFDNYHESLQRLWHELHKKFRPHILLDKSSCRYASFGHLTNYGAKYYGYLWAKVYALDIFAHIRASGLFNNKLSQLYTRRVLGAGGSKDPYSLLKEFLGRAPNSNAFFKDLAL